MKKLQRTAILLGLILSASSFSFSKGNILKNELPKREKDFLESGNPQTEEGLEVNNEVYDESLPKFHIKKIYLRNTAASEKPLVNRKKTDDILRSYENRELNQQDLKELIRKLNAQYEEKGFITTKIYLEPEQNISDGIVKLVALEGRIEDIVVDEDTARDRRREFFAFTNEKDRVFNISHIDNGIDNLNRVESVNATLDIVPGEKQGYSKVIVKTEKKKPVRLNLGYEDTQKDKQKYRIGLEYDNLLGINDNIFLSYSGDVKRIGKRKNDEDNYTKSYSFGYSFPIKTWSFNLSYNNSEDNNYIIGSTSNYKMREKSRQYGIDVSKLMYRNADTKLYLNMGLDVKRDRTYLEGQRLNTQDRNMTVVKAGISGMTKLFNGINSYGITYSQGIKGFRSNEDSSYSMGTSLTPLSLEDDSKYQFKKINMHASYYKPFYFKNQGITARVGASGQYTKDALFSTEKFSIGSFGTVKGFPSSVSGDIGFNTKAELGYILPVDRNTNLGDFLYKVRPYVEYDFGKVRNNFNELGDKKGRIATLSSYSLGARYYGETVTLDFGIAKIDKGRNEVRADKHRGYVSISTTF